MSVCFSRDITKKFWDIIKQQPGVFDKVSENVKTEDMNCPVAWLKIPEIVTDNICTDLPNYDTVIELSLKPNIASEVHQQLADIIQPEALLFFNNLAEIKVINHGQEQTITRQMMNSRKGSRTIINTLNQMGEIVTSKSWWLLSKKFDIQADNTTKNALISIAYNDELSDNANHLYSFYRTNVKFTMPAIIHATFEVTADRKNLLNNEANKTIFKELADFVSQCSERFTIDKKKGIDFALRFAGINKDGCDSPIKDMGFFDALKEPLKQAKIIPTVNEDFISCLDQPVTLPDPMWTYFIGDDVKNLIHGSVRSLVDAVQSLSESQRYHYKLSWLCNLIHKSIKLRSSQEIVDMYKYIYDQYKEEELRNLVNYDSILINTKKHFIHPKKRVFISQGHKIIYNLPSEIQIDFLDEGISQELEKRKLVELLGSVFNVYRYSFKEIASILIEHFQEKDSVEDVMALHSALFQAYQAANENGESTLGVNIGSIKIIDKKGSVTIASTSYFGKDYNNGLTERIYQKMPQKIIGSPEMNGLTSGDQESLQKYFGWLGVSQFPRLVKTSRIQEQQEFIEYVMLNYDYKKYNVGEFKFFDYYDLQSRGRLNSYWHSYELTTVDGLDVILSSISVETLLEWIINFENLHKMLKNDHDYHGSLSLSIGQKQYSRAIDNHCLKSYVRWKIANSPILIDSENTSRKVTPNQCCLAKTIRTEYSPYIVQPKVNFKKLSDILDMKEEGIHDLLGIIGVHMSIKSFNAKALYQILTNLPESDPSGTKAKAIYREILNYDELTLNVEDDTYKHFMNTGKVLSRVGMRTEYVQVNEALYLDNDRYNENILSHFKLIDLDFKRGAKKVEKIFGVKPLRKIDIKLLDEPVVHPLNEDLQRFLYDAQPYVYAIVKNSDTHGQILSSLMSTQIILVSNVRAEMIYNNKRNVINLQPYESIYVIEENTYYLYAEEDMMEFQSIKNGYQFKNSLAQAFTSITESDSDQIFRIVSEDKNNWNAVLKGLFGNDYLIELEAARVKMKRDISEHITFWNLFASCVVDRLEDVSITNDHELSEYLHNIIGESAQEPWLWETETYNRLHNSQIQTNLYKLIKPIDIDFAKLSWHYSQLDFRSEIRRELIEFQSMNDSVFKASFYLSLKDKSIDVKKGYLDNCVKFEELFKFQDVPKYVHDTGEYFKQIILDQFRVVLHVNCSLNINDILRQNIASWEKIVSFPLTEEIRQSNEIKSLLLFEEYDAATKAAEVVIEKSKVKNKVRIGGKDFEYNQISDLNPQLDDLFEKHNTAFNFSSTSKVKAEQQKPRPRKHSSNGFEGRNKSEIGYIAEYLVYKQLVDTYGVDAVEWQSEYAAKAGINFEGRAGRGFDIRLRINNEYRLVEVKAIRNPIVGFQMSKNELNMALASPCMYDVVIVQSITENPEITYIERFFDIPKTQKLTKNSRFTTYLSSAKIVFDLKSI